MLIIPLLYYRQSKMANDEEEKWVPIVEVAASPLDDQQSIASSSSNDGSTFAGFLAYLQTPEGTPPPPEKKKNTNTNNGEKNDTAADTTSSDESPPTTVTNNPKPQLLALPSYYVDSFHEHFFPHSEDEDGPPTRRKKLSIPQRYVHSFICTIFGSGVSYLTLFRMNKSYLNSFSF